MAKKRKPEDDPRPLYRIVFNGDPFMLNRIETIIRFGRDFYEGTTSSAILEAAIEDILAGKPLKDVRYHLEELNPNVRAAMTQLFWMRERGELGA